MEPNKKLGFSEGSGSWAKTPIEPIPFSKMAASPNLPLPPAAGSYQGWKQTYRMNHVHGGGCSSSSSGANKTHVQPSSDNIVIANCPNTTPAIAGNDVDGKNSSSDGDDDNAGGEDHDQNNNTGKTVIVNGVEVKLGRNIDAESMDPRRLKRIISNRASAQKSRLKKLQYVAEMERKARALEAQIAFLAPQVELYTHRKHYVQMEQKALNLQIAAYAEDKLLKDAEIEANKKEVARLRQLQMRQQQSRMQANANASRLMNWEAARLKEQKVNPVSKQSGLEQERISSSNREKVRESAGEVNRQNQVKEAQEKQQNENQSYGHNQQQPGQAVMADDKLADPRQTENASSNQSRPQQKQDNMNSDEGDEEMEDV